MRYISVRGRNTCPSHSKRGDTRLTDQTVVFTARRSSSEQLPVDPPEHTGNRTPGKKNPGAPPKEEVFTGTKSRKLRRKDRKLRNRKQATSRRGCHHVLELEPINGPTTPE
ncbi:unnamed protein product [Brassica napus]|uniref:(rape) hypothetical protein n=1 Tax=Brassica napus TaxID=3708 RepID=A0A816MIC0_BRANA|nr:unnamed protein product [Brassica napus]